MSPPRENVDSGWTKSADKNQEQARGRYFKRGVSNSLYCFEL